MTGLEYCMNEAKVSQKDLVEFLGVPQASISTWVTGKKAIPDKHLLKLSQICHADPILLSKKTVSELDKALIRYGQLASSDEYIFSDEARDLEVKINELKFLEKLTEYIEHHGIDRNGEESINPDQRRMQISRNVLRFSRFMEITDKVPDEFIDSLLTSLELLKKGR